MRLRSAFGVQLGPASLVAGAEHTQRLLAQHKDWLAALAAQRRSAKAAANGPSAELVAPSSLRWEASQLDSRDERVLDSTRAGITARARRDGFGTVRVVGAISSKTVHGESISGGRILAELDVIRDAGSKVVLLDIDSRGGTVVEALAAYRGLRRFAAQGGTVISFVAGAAHSSAALLAVAANYSVAAGGATYVVHHCGGVGEDQENERATLDESVVRILAERTAVIHEQEVRAMMRSGAGSGAMLGVHAALDYGFADELGDRERARDLAALASGPGGLLIHGHRTDRQRLLAERREAKRWGGTQSMAW